MMEALLEEKNGHSPQPDEFFLVCDAILRLGDIVRLQVTRNQTEVTTSNGRRHVIVKSLAKCLPRLPSKLFFRASRECIVNLDYIKKVEPYDQKRLCFKLENGDSIVLSRQQTVAFRRHFRF